MEESGTKTKVSIDRIGAGKAAVSQKRSKDPKDKQEEAALTQARSRAQIASITESNRDLRVNRRMRHDYATRCFAISFAIRFFPEPSL
jgi:hypothetical protein